MKQNNSADIDVYNVFVRIKKSLVGGLVLLFKALDFVRQNWRIIALLILVGAALGYFGSLDSKKAQKASVVLRINFDAVNYVYKEVDLINEKIIAGDSLFFSEMGLKPDSLEVREIVLTPVVNLKELGEKYEETYRNVDGFIKNVEFDKNEIELAKTFSTEYRYHNLELALSSEANLGTVNNLIDYLNKDILLGEIRDTVNENMKRSILSNKNIVGQIDKVIDTYTNNQSVNGAKGNMFVVDKNFSLHSLLNKKTDLLTINDNLRKELILSKDIVVLMNNAPIVKEKPGFFGIKILAYPTLLVFIFLFVAWLRYAFRYLKKIAHIHS